ncbi:phenylalanine--tRNA ligase subunit alpha [Candidatus Gottesmanbacteria bacterium]|nr:phenylalanine--tRNA ligase subunit alpha [Candidatus Gottesmanbacteria bacterium]
MESDINKLKSKALKNINASKTSGDLNAVFLKLFGKSGYFTELAKKLKDVPRKDRPKLGQLVNVVKQELEKTIESQKKRIAQGKLSEWLDATAPGIKPPDGHLHIVSQAIEEITRIFERIGFTRVRYPEIDWDYYAFESLNMPKNHPARDEWETFFIDGPVSPKFGRLVLTPHTSNGQVRGMETLGRPPIRMINIAKCYRRQSDVSHIPMFHQFEGMYIDKNVSIPHLKGFIAYFIKEFFGPERKFRLRPFHFQFTEPSFEVDISCDICKGTGCRFCKDGWLELAGCGLIHPNVLKFGRLDPKIYSGFAIGWGIERTYMMRSDTKLDDIRLLYSNDIRFLEQF